MKKSQYRRSSRQCNLWPPCSHSDLMLSQYRRSSRQCNQYKLKKDNYDRSLNTAEAVDNVIIFFIYY